MKKGFSLKKMTALLLALVMLLSLAACGTRPAAETDDSGSVREAGGNRKKISGNKDDDAAGEKYPVEWDGESLFADYDAWLAAFETIQDFPAQFEQFRGRLHTVEGLLGFMELAYDEQVNAQFDRLYSFAAYGSSVFPAESLYKKCMAKMDTFLLDYGNATAFLDEEMGELTLEEREALFADERLQKYAYQFREFVDPDTIYFTEPESILCNTLNLSRGRMETLYEMLAYTQLPAEEYELPNGDVLLLDEGTLGSWLSDPEIPFELRSELYETWWGHVAEYADTFAYILETEMLEEYASARISGFESTEEWALHAQDLPLDVMDRIIAAAHSGAARYAEYYGLFAARDGTNEYYSFSDYIPLTDYDYDYIPYEEGVDQVLEALGILGEDYVETFQSALTSGFVDVYPQENKTGGAFEMGGFYGLSPFLKFNYYGWFEDVATIAHEGGHACFDLYSQQYQDYCNWNPGIFTQEIASTVNELLFYNYKIDNSASKDEKLFYLSTLLNMWTGTFFRQCFFQEFENYCHETVENGDSLDAEEMAAKWEELSAEYYGENYTTGEYGGYRWATLDHLYYNHYVFQYATSVCYASAIVRAILSGEEGVVESYKDFLKTGDSCSPAEALALVGIDITTDDAYNDGLAYFYSVLDEFETLLG